MRADGMKIIGLTGGIGSGKSTVARLFAELGVTVIDTDEIAHELSRPPSEALEQIALEFGPDFINKDGGLNRPRMRELIFANADAKVKLENIFHPRIKAIVLQQLGKQSIHTPYVLLVVPLLFETNTYSSIIDSSLLVDCSEEHQIERVKLRSGLKNTEITAIIANQLPRKARIQRANDIILNESSLAHLQSSVSTLHQRYQDQTCRFT
ncbi:dephospho-CoA kinase [Iodobacter sp. LRB]|uniref:dephospho-CoA kinase n=1 Tax=unclassified Iodobacter TaxID=235634 RepID=UPI00211E5462|nr:dephospho-CoA kinase [Iodobacter sp. BJB302]